MATEGETINGDSLKVTIGVGLVSLVCALGLNYYLKNKKEDAIKASKWMTVEIDSTSTITAETIFEIGIDESTKQLAMRARDKQTSDIMVAAITVDFLQRLSIVPSVLGLERCQQKLAMLLARGQIGLTPQTYGLDLTVSYTDTDLDQQLSATVALKRLPIPDKDKQIISLRSQVINTDCFKANIDQLTQDNTKKEETIASLQSQIDSLSAKNDSLQMYIVQLKSMIDLLGINEPFSMDTEFASQSDDEKDSEGEPLFIAKLKQYIRQSKDPRLIFHAQYLYLHRREAKACDVDSDGWNALHVCAQSPGLCGMLKWLMNDGNIDPNLKDNWQRTPLNVAAHYGNTAAVKILLRDDKVDLDLADKYGWTPLITAANKDHPSVVSLLIKSGCNQELTSNQRKTALDYARQEGTGSIISLLKSKK